MVFLKEFFKKVDIEKKISRRQKFMKNFPGDKELIHRNKIVSNGCDLAPILYSVEQGLKSKISEINDCQ